VVKVDGEELEGLTRCGDAPRREANSLPGWGAPKRWALRIACLLLALACEPDQFVSMGSDVSASEPQQSAASGGAGNAADEPPTSGGHVGGRSQSVPPSTGSASAAVGGATSTETDAGVGLGELTDGGVDVIKGYREIWRSGTPSSETVGATQSGFSLPSSTQLP